MKLNPNDKTDKESMKAGSHDLYNLLVDLSMAQVVSPAAKLSGSPN